MRACVKVNGQSIVHASMLLCFLALDAADAIMPRQRGEATTACPSMCVEGAETAAACSPVWIECVGWFRPGHRGRQSQT